MRTIGFIIFLLIITESSVAQRFHGGIFAGGVVSQVQGDPYGGFNKIGPYGGGFVSLNFSDLISIQMEFDFIQKGSRENADLEKGKYDSYLLRINYLEVPLLFQLTFFNRLSGEIGPAMDVLISSYEESNQQEVENVIPLRPVTFCGIIGASVFIIPQLKINFRFIMSILSIRDGIGNGYYKRFGQYGQYNDVLSLTLLYKIK